MTQDQPANGRLRVELDGVPETLLWNLYHRAQAARGSDPIILDPKAIELVDRIDYPFAKLSQHQGPAGQWHALRVSAFDAEVRRFLGDNPDGTIVALGEGLETQFWRVDNRRMHWLSVDLAETIELRRKLLPDGPRNITLACSATDEEWTRQVDPTKGLLVTAQGLLMYFQPDEVAEFVAMCADRLPGSTLLFDSVPKWMMSRRDNWLDKSSEDYRPPPWLWGMDKAERARLAAIPGVISLRDLRQPRGRGVVFGAVLPALQRVPTLRYRLPTFPIMVAGLG